MSLADNVFLLIGGSGSGKSTIINILTKEIDNLKTPIIYTTREKRVNEIDKIDYHFINKETFINYQKNKYFIFTYECHNYLYGIADDILALALKNNIILGVSRKIIKDFYTYFKNVYTIYLDVTPEEIEKRIRNRNREINNDEILVRIENAHNKREWIKLNSVDLTISNNEILNLSIMKLKKYIMDKTNGRNNKFF